MEKYDSSIRAWSDCLARWEIGVGFMSELFTIIRRALIAKFRTRNDRSSYDLEVHNPLTSTTRRHENWKN